MVLAERHSVTVGERVMDGERLRVRVREMVGETEGHTDTEGEALRLGEEVPETLAEGLMELLGTSEALLTPVMLTVEVEEGLTLKEKEGLPEEDTDSVVLVEVVMLEVEEAEGEGDREPHMEKVGLGAPLVVGRVAEARAVGEACVTVPAQVLLGLEEVERLCVEERE